MEMELNQSSNFRSSSYDSSVPFHYAWESTAVGQQPDPRFPRFFIAGPQRVGTTWLYEQLVHHPQIWGVETKELYFFSNPVFYPEDGKDDLEHYLQLFEGALKKTNFWGITKRWLKYRQFLPVRAWGEATASYAVLPRAAIEAIRRLNPALKIIFLVRDPIERAWSHAKKDLAREKGLRVEAVSDAAFIEFFEDPYVRRCAKVCEYLDNWESVFGPEQVFVRPFSAISERPTELLLEAFSFLGVWADVRVIRKQHGAPVNATEIADIPPSLLEYLESSLGEERLLLRRRFSGMGNQVS